MNQISEEKLGAIIQSRLSLKDSQLKRFISKSLDLLSNFDKLPADSLDSLHKEVLSELENLEFQILKAEMSHFIRVQDLKTYREQNSLVLKEIAKKKGVIEHLTQGLKMETDKRKFKAECDLMSKEIVEYEDREELMKKVGKAEEEIKRLEEKYQENVGMIENKEKELFLIVFFNI